MKNKRKFNLSWFLIVVLGIGFVVMSLHINQLMQKNNKLSNDITNVEYLNASTQRLSRMVIVGATDNRLMFYVGEQTMKYLDTASKDRLYVVDMPEIREIADDVIDNWVTLSNLLIPTEENEEVVYDIDGICLAADNHFDGMTDLSIAIMKAKQSLTDEIEKTQMVSYFMLVLIAFLSISNVISNSIAMQRSRELAAIASLDIATGLYNRSKCQEIFKNNFAVNRKQQPAIVVIDLNDLKKTNDQLGHRVGDEMIASFATLLKQASNIHTVKPFLGRYGGDEFVVYHEDIESEQEICTFVKELSFITEEFNKKGNVKYTVSYALGYSFNKDTDKDLSVRQLFDQADEAMYENKRRMKKNMMQNQNNKANEV